MAALPTASVLSTSDWLVVAAYGAAIVILGIWTARREPRREDYFLAARASRWPAIGLALLASNISSAALIGLAGAAYASGISVYNYEWMGAVILVLFCLFLLPSVLRSRVYTMPEFLERRYDGRARLFFALLTLSLNIFVDAAGALYSGSLLCRLLVPELSLAWIAVALAGAAGLYTILGGLRAVIYTETLQAVVLLLGASVITFAAFHRVGGWHALMNGVPPAALSLIRPRSDPAVPWPGLAFGIPVLGIYYWCTNQLIVQRVLSARDLDHGRRGLLFAGLLKLPVLLLMVLPGTCAILLFPRLARSDMVYPLLILQLLPAGLMGLVVASFVAATMASVASTLNSASTLLTMDVVARVRPTLSDRQIVRIGRMCTAGFLLLAVLWASQLERFGSLWQYLQAVLAYAVPPIVALFVVGLFWRGANATGAAATVLIGSACSMALFASNAVFHWTHLHFLYAAPLLLLIDVAILIGVSCCTQPPSRAQIEPLMFTAAFFREDSQRLRGVPRWRNYRLQAAALLLLTAGIVIAFR